MASIISIFLCTSAIAVFAQSMPNLHQPTAPVYSRAITKEASRLKIDPRSYGSIFQEIREIPSGTLEVRLIVKPNGVVTDFEKIEGSNQLWFTFRGAWRKIRFSPTREGDIGPWEVTLVVSANSSGGGGMLEARATGRSSSSSSTRIYIADVKSVLPTSK